MPSIPGLTERSAVLRGRRRKRHARDFSKRATQRIRDSSTSARANPARLRNRRSIPRHRGARHIQPPSFRSGTARRVRDARGVPPDEPKQPHGSVPVLP